MTQEKPEAGTVPGPREPAFGPQLPPGARIGAEGHITYCTDPAHRDGEHGRDCLPPAEPGNPELRLIRAIWGLCPDHDECPPGAHEDEEFTHAGN